MRIIGGKYRGIGLASVGKGDTAAHLRPTTDRVRESLFNLLQHGPYPDLENARVLDLFAGTGALGLEAISRGASAATFVDDGAKALALIKENVAKMRVEDQAIVMRRNATRLGENTADPYDLIFLDPPYGKKLGEKALVSAVEGNWIARDGLIIWEESSDVTPLGGMEMRDSRKYGDSIIKIFEFTG